MMIAFYQGMQGDSQREGIMFKHIELFNTRRLIMEHRISQRAIISELMKKWRTTTNKPEYRFTGWKERP